MTAKQPEPGKKEEDEFSVAPLTTNVTEAIECDGGWTIPLLCSLTWIGLMAMFLARVTLIWSKMPCGAKTPFEPSLPTIRHDFTAYLQ